MNSIWVGFDPREGSAFAVARYSVRRRLTQPIPVRGLRLHDLQQRGLYTRPTKRVVNGDGRFHMVDELSVRPEYDGRVSTEHALARFLVPHLAREGWALFMDGDMLARANLARLFNELDTSKAVYCVHHRHEPVTESKMDGQVQTRYPRKNWTSFIAFNVGHEANRALTLEAVNTLPGRDLHRLCWLDDNEIGELDPSWNFLVGHSDPSIEPKVIHFTDGLPDMPGYENCDYADAWREELSCWAA